MISPLYRNCFPKPNTKKRSGILLHPGAARKQSLSHGLARKTEKQTFAHHVTPHRWLTCQHFPLHNALLHFLALSFGRKHKHRMKCYTTRTLISGFALPEWVHPRSSGSSKIMSKLYLAWPHRTEWTDDVVVVRSQSATSNASNICHV